MPETPKALLIASAVIEGVVGLIAIILPGMALMQAYPGIENAMASEYAMRLAGTALLALGALSWLVRDATDASVLKPVLSTLLAYNVLAVLNFGFLTMGPVPSALAPTILHLLLSGGFLYYLRKAD